MVINSALFHIDITENEPEIVSGACSKNGFKDYINGLEDEIASSKKRKAFTFASERVEAYTAIMKVIGDEFDDGCKLLATQLHEEEVRVQENYADCLRYEVQRGSLIILHISGEDNINQVMLAKTDHIAFLGENLLPQKGMPTKKKLYKGFFVAFDSDNNVTEAYAFDTTNKIARYWWQGFLGLKEVRTNTHNTSQFWKGLKKHVLNPLRKKSKSDSFLLYNAALGYFRSNDSFDVDEFILAIFDGYSPYKAFVDTEKLKEKVRIIAEKENCDTQFEIDQECFVKVKPNRIELSDEIILELRDNVDNLQGTAIKAVEYEREKGVFICTDSGYSQFNIEDNE